MRELPTLMTEKWILRPFQKADTPLVQKASMDPLIPLITSIPAVYSEPSAIEYIDRQNQRHVNGVGYSFAIADQESDVAVGSVFLGLNQDDPERANLGYWLIQEYRGKKILPQVLPCLIQWAHDELKMVRLELYVEPWNHGSIKIAEALGFQKEGLMRSWQRVGNERKDMFMFSRIRY